MCMCRLWGVGLNFARGGRVRRMFEFPVWIDRWPGISHSTIVGGVEGYSSIMMKQGDVYGGSIYSYLKKLTGSGLLYCVLLELQYSLRGLILRLIDVRKVRSMNQKGKCLVSSKFANG